MDSPEQCHEPIANRDRGAGREVVVVQGWRQNLTGDTELNGPRPASWWTGRVPAVGSCPGVAADGTLRSLPLLDLSACSRAEVLDYFHNGWALTETLFSALQGEEAFYRPPFHRLRHAMIFYYAHPAALYVNKLRLAGLVAGPVDAHFEQLFETGVDEMAWDDLSKNELKWPSVREVTEYRRTVYGIVRRLIETHPCFEALPIDQQSPAWALMLGMEHERIHLELSSVLVRELPLRLVRRPEVWAPYHASAGSLSSEAPTPSLDFPRNEMISIPSGSVVLGKPRAVPSYSWDNAYGERAFAVRAFDVSKFPISHGEWLAFIVAGGYQTPRYWSEAGWAWRTSRNAKAPAFWVPDGPAGSNLYRFRLLFDVVDMPWSWPVSVNYFEAKAYCAWLTEREGGDQAYRLISEPEHHRIRPRGAATDAANLELSFGSESPVDAFPPGFEGVHDVRGNVWTWCEDHFAALPGFAPDPLYDDFSTPCFDGKHQLILGGSFVSTGDEASVWARFHFRPHFHQHAGFRLVRSAHALQKSCADAPPPHVGGKPCCTNLPAVASPYDTNELLFQYLTLHFATAAETAPGPMIHPDVVNFPRRTAEAISAAAARYGVETSRALDIGCAVGGASFELGRVFREVIGVDLSESFVSTARTLQTDGRFPYSMRMEGDLLLPMEAVVDAALDRGRVSFRQADACSLPADLGSFAAVLSSNLLCRLPSPGALLGRLGGPRGLVKPGGLLLNISPWSWMENFTPKSAWLGGSVVDGSARRSSDGLAEALRGEFELLETYDFPLIIREHARKFQYITPEATLWRRRRTP